MNKEKRRVPKLRFPGFTEDWEQRKLNEFLSVSNFKNIDNKYNKNDVLSVSGDYGIVNQIEFQGRSFAGVSVSNYGLVETGDIVYTKSPLKLNPYGIIKANRINAGIVSTLYAIYKTKKNCDSKFIEHYFNLDSRLNKYLKPLVNKGAKNDMKVSSENALIGEVCFPHVTEQKLIAVFLDRLDLFITLHQRKLEHLNLKKKALLQKLFPKNGARYPELRFPGFTDAWEQRKLGEIVNSYSGGTPTASNKEYYGGDIPFIRSAEINSDSTELYITQKGLDNSSAKIVEKGTILYAMYGATSGEVGISKINGAINQAILAMIPLEYNGKIIAQYLRKNKESITGKYLQGGQGNLSANIILELPIQLPGLEESNQIANFLESFDNIITLHQQEPFLCGNSINGGVELC